MNFLKSLSILKPGLPLDEKYTLPDAIIIPTAAGVDVIIILVLLVNGVTVIVPPMFDIE